MSEDTEFSDNNEFKLWDAKMRKRLYAFWNKGIFDDEDILAADPALKVFAKRLPAMGVDQCETFEAWCDENSGVANEYHDNPEPPDFDPDFDGEDPSLSLEDEAPAAQSSQRGVFCSAPEPDPYDTWMDHLQQVRAKQAMAALMKSKDMLKALSGSAPVRRPTSRPTSRPARQRGAQTRSAAKSGDSNSDDPDPADQIIADPCKNDPRVLAYGDNPTSRSIRKAIMALRQQVQHPAADYYVQWAGAEMMKQVEHRVRCMPFRIHADTAIPLILDAALSLLYGLAEKHIFEDSPNPNFYNIVQSNIRTPANLREVANRLRGAGSRLVDILDVEAGLARAEDDRACAARLSPITDADGEEAEEEAADVLPARDVQSDPLLAAWVQEMVDAGQRPDFDDDPDGAVSAAVAAAVADLGVAGVAVDTLLAVLDLVAKLPEAEWRERGSAIFEALDFLDGCATAQHRADKLRTVARNARGLFSPDVQQAAANLLIGAGLPV